MSGGQKGAQVGVSCPACSPETEVVHEVLSPGGQATVRCRECGHVHKTQLPRSTTHEVRAVVSFGDESERTTTNVPVDETLRVGEEFVAKLPEGPTGVRITSLEIADGQRVEHANAESIGTIWTRAVDNVSVPVTIHPATGDREGTKSETYYLPGDERVTVGEGIPHLDESIRIEHIVLRGDAIAYDREKIDTRGDSVPAKDVKRVYARREADQWRSAWG